LSTVTPQILRVCQFRRCQPFGFAALHHLEAARDGVTLSLGGPESVPVPGCLVVLRGAPAIIVC
jgi:hypothetical protein